MSRSFLLKTSKNLFEQTISLNHSITGPHKALDRARDMMDFLELEKSPMNGYQLRALARGV